MRFSDKWVKNESKSRSERLKEMIKPTEPLKTRFEEARRKIEVQEKKLNTELAKLKARDSFVFKKMVTAVQKHDVNMCTALSNELAEVRKTAKIVSQTKNIFEQITLRLSTIKDTGDIVVTLAPVVGSIRNVRSGLARVMPEAEYEMREISSLLSDVVMNAGRLGGLILNFEVANEDAEKILEEASAVAEQKMKEDFPKIPKLAGKSDQSPLDQS
ncbi:MAG: Snf7 family protein [Candidatus Methylarchaceae archaeon HK02M1]|nr:Snf7 family protein [Candidatus Methylarchaceae archaeon HK02M1]